MESGANGLRGVRVPLHVVAELKLEHVCATILPHSTTVFIVLLMVQLIQRSLIVIQLFAVSVFNTNVRQGITTFIK